MEPKELQRHILMLATLPQTASPVVSCHFNREHGQPDGRQLLEGQVRSLRGSLVPKWQRGFEEALKRIDDYLRQTALEDIVGLAMFARTGEQPLKAARPSS